MSFNSRPSTRSFNTLLQSLIYACCLCLATALFCATTTKLYIMPNLVSYNIVLMDLVVIGDFYSMLKVLDKMTDWGIIPDVVIYTMVLTT
jgi:pentatricopeptide repeat protein